MPWNGPVHYAQSGATVAIGLDRKLVAATVTPNPSTAAFGSDKLDLPGSDKSAAILGVVAIADVIPLLFEKSRPDGPVVPAEDVPMFPGGVPGLGNQLPDNLVEEIAKAKKEFIASLNTPFSGHHCGSAQWKRIANRELFQSKVQSGGLKATIDSGSQLVGQMGQHESGPFPQFYPR